MRKIFSILFALALVLGFSLVATTPVAAATTYYVATTGSDTNDGSSGAPWLTIQYAVSHVGAGDTIMVAAGTYPEVSQTTITQNVIIIGADKTTTIIKRNTGFTGNYFFRVDSGEFNLSGVTLDGEGNLYGGVRYAAGTSTGTIDNNIIKNIVAPSYTGFGVVAYGDDVVVSNNIFTNIGRVGVWVGGNNGLVTGNTYTGKGAIDCLDYGIEVGMGGVATITDNTITNCLGVASVDGSTSAGILVTTYYGAGTTATITGNTLTGNTGGIGVGYDASDTSTVVAHYNSINGNTDYGIDTTAPTVDAVNNWWGDDSGPNHTSNPSGTGDVVSDNVDFNPWVTTSSVGTATGTGTASFVATGGPISDLTPVPLGSLPPAAQATKPINFPDGLFSFTITGLSYGETVTVTITLPPGAAPTQYWKYHASEGGWIQIPMTIVGPPNVITITLQDGGLGDDDGAIDGIIVDQGGSGNLPVGWETYPINKVRVLLPWIALFAAIMAGASLLVLRRRRAQS